MKKILLFAILMSIVVFILFISTLYLIPKKQDSKKTISISGHKFQVIEATHQTAWIKGLSGIKSIKDNEGMLFIFPKTEQKTFWMKKMNFSLDIIFINGNKIVDFATLETPSANQIPIYTSRHPADRVLEINAGLMKKYGFKIGDQVNY